MLPFVLIASTMAYCVMYWLWAVAKSQPQNMHETIQIITAMFLVPDEMIFFLFRGLLLATAFYVVADFLITSARRKRKHTDDEIPDTLQLKYIYPRK